MRDRAAVMAELWGEQAKRDAEAGDDVAAMAAERKARDWRAFGVGSLAMERECAPAWVSYSIDLDPPKLEVVR